MTEPRWATEQEMRTVLCLLLMAKAKGCAVVPKEVMARAADDARVAVVDEGDYLKVVAVSSGNLTGAIAIDLGQDSSAPGRQN